MRKARPQHRRCEGPCCDHVFVPQRRNQRYCQPSCRDAADCRRINGQADTHAQISAKMLNEAFYIYNEYKDVLIKKNEEPASARMPSTPQDLRRKEETAKGEGDANWPKPCVISPRP
jgi:hypothetical protein